MQSTHNMHKTSKSKLFPTEIRKYEFDNLCLP